MTPVDEVTAFESLLRWLHPDREQAGVKYEELRVKLTRFFERFGSRFAEEGADETLQRAACKLAEGVKVFSDNPYSYCRGIARNLMLEQWRDHEKSATSLDDLPPRNIPTIQPGEDASRQRERLERERLLECLEGCLQSLPDESRLLFLEYQHDAGRAKIDRRSSLAERLGIDITALRNRLTRLRKKIEACTLQCAAPIQRN